MEIGIQPSATGAVLCDARRPVLSRPARSHELDQTYRLQTGGVSPAIFS
jgi:hypothetical protein